MSRRGRPARHYRIQARTERREPIDYAALARAALEQAAMNQPREEDTVLAATRAQVSEDVSRRDPYHATTPKESRRDRLA